MTTKDEALRIALEALEMAKRWHKGDKWRNGTFEQRETWATAHGQLDEAITAIKQAQAQPFSPRELMIANEQYRHEQQQKRAQAQQFMGFDVVVDPSMAPNEMKLVQPQAPYSNCRFKICDLPGQCKGEGKCHHPAVPQAQQAQEPVEIEYFGLEPWERDKPTSPTAGMNIAQRILHVGGRNNEAGYVEFGSIQAVDALVRQVLRDLPAPKQAEPAVQESLTVQDLDTCRQWFDSVQDTNGGYLTPSDYVLAAKLYRTLGIRVPSSITTVIAAAPTPPEATNG